MILFVLDDTSASVFPAFSAPVVWPDPDNPPATTSTNSGEAPGDIAHRREAERRRADLNRLAARLYARDDGHLGFNPPNVDPQNPGSAPRVVPIDLDVQANGSPSAGAATAAGFQYTVDSTTNPKVTGILSGHGGIRRLVEAGVVFPRLYATSALCSPTRAGIMSGRHPEQVGVPANKQDLNENELVWAGFLKQMCQDGDDATPCYRTGYIGKWHLGNSTGDGKRQALWTRGFDEAVYDTQNSRWHWARTPLRCSSGSGIADAGPWTSTSAAEHRPGYFCTKTSATATSCYIDADCSAGQECTTVWKPSGNNPVVAGKCYPVKPAAGCNPRANDPCTASGEVCRRWGLYVGPVAGRQYCHPEDEGSPHCCSPGGSDKSDRNRDGRYAFSKKMKDKAATHGFPLFSSGKGAPCGDSAERFFDNVTHDDNSTADEACMYDTRYQRDFATSFITRHAHGQQVGDSGERFALYIATHATHVDRGAPESTIAHYETLSDQKGAKAVIPNQARQFWAALEEVDAAIGSIMRTLEGFCDSTGATAPEAYPKYGRTCSTNSDCNDGNSETTEVCNQSLKSQTLVMLTSDQGTEEAGFGQPRLRDGKGGVYEGGIRVGLHAWAPSLGLGDFAAAGAERKVEAAIGSHVDLAATILHAAGCEPASTRVPGGYDFTICNDKTRQPCDSGNPCASGAACVTRSFEGRSLLPLLEDGETAVRDYAFAEIGANLAVVSRPGLFDVECGQGDTACQSRKAAVKVCGFTETRPAEADTPETQEIYDPHVDRVRTAGSCRVCSTGADCDKKECIVAGRYCVQNGLEGTRCRDGEPDTTCIHTSLTRCTGAKGSECPADHTCEKLPIVVDCEDKCTEVASWKLKANQSGNGANPVELFDLATNPEELALLNCLAPNATPQESAAAVTAVRDHLDGRLDAWVACTHQTPPAISSGVQIQCDEEAP